MNRLLIFRCLRLLALAAIFLPNRSAAAEYALREWHGEDGLPSEIVSGIAQDEKGYLWLAADAGGAARFNGISFEGPKTLTGEEPAMFVRSLVVHPEMGALVSSNDAIWQWDGNALRKNPLTDRFSKQPIQSWHIEPDGTLWAGFFDGKIECLRAGRVSELDQRLHGGRPGRQAITFAGEGKDAVWIAAGNALYRSVAGKVTRIALPGPETELRITSSLQGHPWIVTRDRVCRWDGRELKTVVAVPELLGAHFVRSLLEDRQGNLWVGTRSQGVYLVTGDRYRVVPTSHRTVAAIFQDNEDNIWLGTSGGGLSRLQAKNFRLFDSKAGLQDDLTLSLCEDERGRLWFANRDGGVARLGQSGVEVMTGRNNWPKSTASRIVAAPGGGVWFFGGVGLVRVDAADGIRQIDTKRLPIGSSMLATRNGELWLARESGGLARVDETGLSIFDASAGLPECPVSCIAQDAEGRLLVGTTEGGLLRFDGTRFEPIRRAGAAPLLSIRQISPQGDGSLWIAAGGGLAVLSGGRESLLTAKNGLPDGAISQLLFDDLGAVWLGSTKGVFRVERREIEEVVAGRSASVKAVAFGKNEGLEHVSCVDGYQPNSVKGRDGTLWFTTRLGVLAIDPGSVRSKRRVPVYIDGLRVDDAAVPLSSAGRLRPDLHKLEVRFSVLNFTAPERTPVRYRLEGFDQAWIDAGTERKAVYPRLMPGSYRLRIASVDERGEWSETGAELRIAVIPFWWQTDWFRFGTAAAFVALLVLAVRARSHRRLRARLERIERESAIDRERTRIARDIHDELGASLTRISLLTQSAQPEAAAEAARSCFNEIYTTTTDITRSIDEIVWAVDPRHDNLDSLVSYFDSYAQGFLSLAKIRYRLDAPSDFPETAVGSSVRHNLFLAFKEALNNCVKHAGAAEVSVRIELDGGRLVVAVADDGAGLSGEASPRAGGGSGLPNLTARLAALGGGAAISRGKNGGTEVVLTVPLSISKS